MGLEDEENVLSLTSTTLGREVARIVRSNRDILQQEVKEVLRTVVSDIILLLFCTLVLRQLFLQLLYRLSLMSCAILCTLEISASGICVVSHYCDHVHAAPVVVARVTKKTVWCTQCFAKATVCVLLFVLLFLHG